MGERVQIKLQSGEKYTSEMTDESEPNKIKGVNHFSCHL